MAATKHAPLETVAEVIASMQTRFHPECCQDVKASYHWRLSGSEERAFTVEVDHGAFRIVDGARSEADVFFEADTETYLRLVNGTLRGIVAIMTRKLRVRGSLQLAAKMDRIFV